MRSVFLLLCVFLFISCSDIESENPATLHGLSHIAIEIRESDFNGLLKDDLVNEYKAVTIERNGIKQNGKIRRRGNVSRYYPKPSFNLEFGGEEWHLVASNIDKSYLREIFGYKIFEEHGFLVPKTEFAAVSINNIYQGLYILREPIDEKFFERRNLNIYSLYEVRTGGRFTHKDGFNSNMSFEKHFPQSSVSYNDLNELIQYLDEENYVILENILETKNIAYYSFISSVINHYDGITKNLYIASIQQADRAANKFQLIPYDLDLTFGQHADENVVIPEKLPKYENGLLETAEEMFLNGRNRNDATSAFSYSIARNTYILDNLKNEILQAYQNDPYLQGEDLDGHIAKIKEYISNF